MTFPFFSSQSIDNKPGVVALGAYHEFPQTEQRLSGMIQPLIQRLAQFGPLPETDRAILRKIGSEARVIAAQTDLVREGDAPRDVFLVLEGFACRYKTDAQGQRQIMAYVLPGDLCDVDAAFLRRMDHSIGTISDCRVVRIAPDTMSDMLQRPALARALRMATLVEVANAREWIVNIGRRSAASRLAHLICELHARMDAVGLTEGDSFDMPLTQTDLADTMGMSYVHMNRSIKELREAALIALRHRRLTVLDLLGLRARGEFQSAYLHLDQAAA